MRIDDKVILFFKVRITERFVYVVVKNYETQKTCVYKIGDGYDDSDTIAYVFGSKKSREEYVFVGYGCHSYDSLIINKISMRTYRCGYSDISYYVRQEMENDIASHNDIFYSIDLKKVLFPEKARLNFRQIAFALNKDIGDAEELIRGTTDIIESIFINSVPKVSLRLRLFYKYRINAISADDTILGYKYLINRYLDNTKENYSQFISKKTSPSLFRVSQFVHFSAPNNDVLKNYFEESINEVIDPTKTSSAIDKKVVIPDVAVLSVGVGGVRSINEPESFKCNEDELIVKYDVSSMFPSIMCNNSLFPRHLNDEFRRLYTELFEKRIKAKKDGNEEVSSFLKIVINSIIGMMNADWSCFYDPTMNCAIRIASMFTTLQLLDILINDSKIIQVNVDGIFILAKKQSMPAIQERVDMFSKKEKLRIEKETFTKMFQMNVNDYFALKTDGTVIKKGIFDTKETSRVLQARIVSESIINELLYGFPAKDTILKCKDITKFFLSTNVSGSFKVFHGDKVVNNTVRFFYAHGIDAYKLTRKQNDKISIVDNKSGVVVVDVIDRNDIKRVNYTPYFGMANKITQLFKQLSLF